MGYIKEPVGVDFFVDPKPLTAADRKRISEIIAYYKDKMLSHKLGLFMGCLYHNREDAHEWIQQKFDNIKNNL